MLRGIGVGIAGVMVGCGGDDSNANVDANTIDALPGCMPSELCIDISQAPNTALGTVGGAVIIASSAGSLIVVRKSTTEVAALSARCTHQGTTVVYAPDTMKLDCPAHGAEFSLAGAVLMGPAMQPLKAYVASLSGNVITIKLA
jgi:cytochrome b6-f complex iron-sulfur subunit